jgi:acyl carrier protein
MATRELRDEIKETIVSSLSISDVDPNEIDDALPLMENSLLDLDSVDILEMVVALQRKYDVRIDDQNLARTVLQSIDTIAEFVESSREK